MSGDDGGGGYGSLDVRMEKSGEAFCCASFVVGLIGSRSVEEDKREREGVVRKG